MPRVVLGAYDERHPRWRRRLIGAAVAAVLLLSFVGGYLALTKHRTTEVADTAARANGPGAPGTAPRPSREVGALRPMRPTDDPETFAVDVAHALFDWDTTWTVPLSDYTGRLIAVADPAGEESPGLVDDLANYLPSAATWAQLRSYSTKQRIEIDSVSVPRLWAQAVAEAGAGDLPPGSTAYTIDGVRHRAGVWDGESVTTEHDVAFTVFIVCRPSYPTCHLLRLSRLNQPLE